MELPDHSLIGVRTRRQYLQVSAKEMADRLGITVTTYNRFERGERRPYFDQAIVIARTLGCTTDDLTHLPTPEQVAQLYAQAAERASSQTSPSTPGAPTREQQTELEHSAAAVIQSDLADHGFGTVVGDAALAADWGDPDDE